MQIRTPFEDRCRRAGSVAVIRAVIAGALAAALVSCTSTQPPVPSPTPAPSSAQPLTSDFPPLPASIAGDDTGSSDIVTDFAALGDTVAAVGMVSSNRLTPVFRYSTDAGVSWQLGGLSEASARAEPPDGGDQALFVAAAPNDDSRRWLAIGTADDGHLAWTSDDGRVWDRHPIDPWQLSGDRDSVSDLLVTPDGFLLVGTRDDGQDRPMAWRSVDGLAWTAAPLGGKGSVASAAVQGSTVVAVGSTASRGEDSYASWASHDRGRTWRAGEKVPAPGDDSGFSRSFSSVTATADGFTAIGSYHAEEWQPSLHTSESGRSWRVASSGAIGEVTRSEGDDVVETGPRALAITQQLEPSYRPRLWVHTGGGWEEVDRTPLDSEPDRVEGFVWVADTPTPIAEGWLVVASRQDNGRVRSEIWRSADNGRTFEVVDMPRAPGEQPTVWPRGAVRLGDQTVVVGDSRRRPVVWQRTGNAAFGIPTLVSKRLDERVEGLAAGSGTVLAYGSRSAAGDDIGVVWRREGKTWTASKAGTFSEAGNDYATSSINDVTWWRKRWVAVGSTSRNGSLNASALAATSPDGATWRRGRGAKTYAKAGGDVWYDVTDLEGDHDRTREMASVTGVGNRLVAVGTSSEGKEDRATVWASVDGQRWSMTRLPLDGLAWTRLSAVVARGSTVVALGTGAATEDAASRLVSWTSTDRGRSWRRQLLDPGLKTDLPLVVATSTGFAVVSFRADPVARPALLVATDGRTWRERPFNAIELPAGTGAFPTGVHAEGADVVVLLRVLTRGGGGVTRLSRQNIR